MASLCGQAQFVTTELSTDVAAWYCVNSACLNQPADRDTFRFHLYNMLPMIDIVNALGYPIDKGVIAHLTRSKAVLSTLSGYKKLSTSDKKNFKEAIRCLYQKGVEINKENIRKEILDLETFVRFIPIDGKASEAQINKIMSILPKEIRNLSVEEAVHIGNLMDAQKSASDIFIDYNFVANKLPEAAVDWAYKLTEYEKVRIPICPRTMRPYMNSHEERWDEHAEKCFSIPVDQMIKGQRYFEQFVIKYEKLPTKDELILFYYNRYVVAGKKTTLPYKIEQWSEEVIEEFELAVQVNGKITFNKISSSKKRFRVEKMKVIKGIPGINGKNNK